MFLEIDRKNPAKLALRDEEGAEATYGQIAEYMHTIAEMLPTRELVFCLCRNVVGSMVWYLSLYQNRDVALLLGANTDKQLVHNLMAVYRPAYIVVPSDHAEEYQMEERGSLLGYSLLKTSSSSPLMNENLSFLLSTSGSLGSPKLVRHQYGNLEENAKNVWKVFQWGEDERSICDLPMQYTMGLNVINSTLCAGGTALLYDGSLTDMRFWDFIENQKGTNFTGVPYSYEVLDKLRFTRMKLPHLTTIAQGGGKLTDAMFTKLADYAERNGKRFFATFGTTETSARLAYLPPELSLTKCGSIGKAIPGGELLLVDDKNQMIPEMEAEGEMVYRGPNVTMGYAEKAEDLALGDVFSGEYFTGDIARRDADGFFYIVGRKKRFLKLYGLRISLDQIERQIETEFGFSCACVGNDKVMTIVVEGSCDETGIIDYVSRYTGLLSNTFKVVKINSIPRNDSGKIKYNYLTETVGKLSADDAFIC